MDVQSACTLNSALDCVRRFEKVKENNMGIVRLSSSSSTLHLVRQWSRCLPFSCGRTARVTCICQNHLRDVLQTSRGLHLCKYHTSRNTVRPPFLNIMKEGYLERTAIVDCLGNHSYSDLIKSSTALARYLLAVTPRDDAAQKKGSGVILNGERVAVLCPNDISFVVSQFAVWMSGCTVVPLCKVHPEPELEYIIQDSQSSVVITTKEYSNTAHSLAAKNNLKVLILNEDFFLKQKNSDESSSRPDDDTSTSETNILEASNSNFNDLELIENPVLTRKWNQVQWRNRKAMIVYTSGTTGRPKGVVQTFAALQAQITMLLHAWEWNANDVILHILPLHHVHGLVNLLACPLWCGATCVMLPEFNADRVWDRLLDDSTPRINLFMAVPTVYAKLIERFESKFKGHKVRAFIKAKLTNQVRLMVVGSAAIPRPVLEHWEAITGHRLLERYGMTELGMALANPLHGPRVPGAVGNPLPTVNVRIVDGNGNVCVSGNSKRSKVKPGSEVIEGELQVKGPAVFTEYWNRPEATAESFTEDGWFKTGDTALFQDGLYRILGRTSVDIIKSGGYKISALDVERHLLAHDKIHECTVVGVPDVTWGQRVAAVVILKDDSTLSHQELRDWARNHMAPYAIPTELKVLDKMPLNAMGKVNKKQLLVDIFKSEEKF